MAGVQTNSRDAFRNFNGLSEQLLCARVTGAFFVVVAKVICSIRNKHFFVFFNVSYGLNPQNCSVFCGTSANIHSIWLTAVVNETCRSQHDSLLSRFSLRSEERKCGRIIHGLCEITIKALNLGALLQPLSGKNSKLISNSLVAQEIFVFDTVKRCGVRLRHFPVQGHCMRLRQYRANVFRDFTIFMRFLGFRIDEYVRQMGIY